MSQGIPRKVSVSGEKIHSLVFEKIFPAMQGEPTDAMVLSLICAASMAMRPRIPQEKLQQVIMDTSAYLIMQLQDEPTASEAN